MVHHRDAGNVEFLRELADADAGTRLEHVHDAAARLVRERMEDGRHVVFGRHVIT